MSALILSVFLILIFDGIVSAAEAAILSLSLNRAEMLAKKSKLGKVVLALKKTSEQPITTLISLSNLITIVGSVITGIMASRVFGEVWVWPFAIVLTFLIMFFAEIIPKKLGEQYAETVTVITAPFILLVSKIFSPITFLISKIIQPLLPYRRPATSEEEIAYLVSIGGQEGVIEAHESRIIQQVFKLNDVTAADMMTPKPFVFMLDGNRTLGESLEDITSAKHSRIPVYDGSPNKIIGIAHLIELAKALTNGKQGMQLKEFIHEPLVVSERRLGDDLLRDFQESKKQLGIVVDDHGNVSGIVGLEDVLEELVGEIAEEKDIAPELIKRLSRNIILAHSQTQVSYLNHFFNIDLPNHRTLNGFLLDHIGHLPDNGEIFDYQNLQFVVEQVSHSAIEKVKIIKNE